MAQAEGGIDQIETGARVFQAGQVLGGGEVDGLGQEAAGEAQGQGQAAAQLGNGGSVAADARRDLEQQVPCVGRREGVELAGQHPRESEVPAGGDEEDDAGRGEQRLHLGAVGGVVQQQEGALAVEDGAVEGREFGCGFRQAGGRLPGADDVGHDLSGGKGVRIGPAQVEVELGVGVARGDAGRQLQGQGGLADAAHAGQAGDGHAAGFQGGGQGVQVVGAAGEVGGRGG